MSTFVAAFTTDPALRFFFPDDTTYPELAARFAGYLFDKRVARGSAYVIDGGSAVSMWDAPGGSGIDASQAAGAAIPALDLPADATARLAAYDDAVHELIPSSPHWYLGVLATHPACAGRGWGLSVMRAGLDRAAKDGLPAFLETTNPANVAWYGRAGWEIFGTATGRRPGGLGAPPPGRGAQIGSDSSVTIRPISARAKAARSRCAASAAGSVSSRSPSTTMFSSLRVVAGSV